MSLNDLYQATKREKKECSDKVVFESQLNEVKKSFDAISLAMAQLQNDVNKLKDSVVDLEAQDLKSYNDKHARIKSSYNDLVTAYNMHTTESRSVIAEFARRMNEIEARLNL